MADQTLDPRVALSQEKYNKYKEKADPWIAQSKKNWDYYLNKQWTTQEVEELGKRGQAALVINRIFPAIQHELAIMSGNRPRYKVTAREDGDVQTAKLFDDLLQYIWYISDGDTLFSQGLQDCLVSGKGYMYAYVDKHADFGRGEIKLGGCSGKDVFVDPNSKDMLHRDAEHILIVKNLSKAQAKFLMPDFSGKIDQSSGYAAEDSISSNLVAGEGQSVLGDSTDDEGDKVTYIERYTKVRLPMYVINFPDRGIEVVTVQQFKTMLDSLPEEAKAVFAASATKIKQPRIKITASVGSTFLYEKTLPLSEYPIVPFVNIYTGTPNPMGDPAFLMGAQDMVNKLYSLMIGHAQTSTNNKVIAHKDAFENPDEVEQKWSRPGAWIWANPGKELPKTYPPQELPNALYTLSGDLKYEMQYTPGVFAMSMGSTQDAPDTFRATLAIEEFGNRRLMLKLRYIERALTALARITIEYIQNVYTTEKTFRIVNPQGVADEVKINQPGLVDWYEGKVISRVNDVTVGHFDVIALAGSTLPSNRWALADEYFKWYQAGLVDDIEVLKKLDIFDREGVIQRKSKFGQLLQQNEQMQTMLEQMSKQLEAAIKAEQDGEKKLELEKFKSNLDKLLIQAKADLEVAKAKQADTPAKGLAKEKKDD